MDYGYCIGTVFWMLEPNRRIIFELESDTLNIHSISEKIGCLILNIGWKNKEWFHF